MGYWVSEIKKYNFYQRNHSQIIVKTLFSRRACLRESLCDLNPHNSDEIIILIRWEEDDENINI